MREAELEEGARPGAPALAPPGAALPSAGTAEVAEPSVAPLFEVPATVERPASALLDPWLPGVEPWEGRPRRQTTGVPRRPLASRTAERMRGLLAARVSVAFLVQSSLAFVVAHFLLFNLSVVRGGSMSPGIHDGDRIVIDPFAYVFGEVERGDVVVLKYPLDPSVDYVKRVIGLPGDEVVIESGRVWVNGVALEEPYVADVDLLSRSATRVKPAHYFVLGDNRPRSSDSRDFGQVPAQYVRGRVEMRLWPIDRAGAVR